MTDTNLTNQKIAHAARLVPALHAEAKRLRAVATEALGLADAAQARLRVAMLAKRKRAGNATGETRKDFGAALDALVALYPTPAPDAPDDTTEEAPPPEETPS